MKIGVLGGTFNPIHNAHIQMACAAKAEFELERILFVPDAEPYHKQTESITAQARVEMTQEAVLGIPGFSVSLVDIQRGGSTYSVDTLRELRLLYPEDDFFFLLGGDSLEKLHTWKDAEELCSLTEFIAFRRKNTCINGEAARNLRERYRCVLHLAAAEVDDISSTEIRDRVRAGASIAGLVPEKVREYIERNGLYQQG